VPERPLAGTLAVVTGALGNLGPVWVTTLADAGADVIGLDVRDTGAEALAERTGGAFELLLADVCDRAALEAVAERHPTPGVLVNNAGIDQPPDAGAVRHAIEDVPLPDFLRTLEVNVAGLFAATQAFGSRMARAGGGAIVNVGSLYASIAPDPALYDHLPGDPPFLKPPAYGASKAAVLQLTRYFARLWGPSGVRVNALSPGGVRGGQDPEFVAKFCARTALGRMAELDDLAGPLLFLCTDASRYVTGTELRVDGGFLA
jgi:NAD(P)-dependent dehydrogenase (short-subunit alcohol dehydrogenase family)